MSSKVNAAQGAQRATAGSSAGKAQAAKQEQAPNSVINNGRPKQKAIPKEPKKKEITLSVKYGDTLFEIAMRYGVSVEDIKKANGLQYDSLKVGQELKFTAYDPKEKDEWDNYQAQLLEQKIEQEKKATIERKNRDAQSKIAMAQEYGYDDKYTFSKDEASGNIKLTLKADRKFSDIKDDFNIPDGVIRQNNNDLEGIDIPVINCDKGIIKNADNATAKKGMTLIIDTDAFNPDKPILKTISDWWNSLWN